MQRAPALLRSCSAVEVELIRPVGRCAAAGATGCSRAGCQWDWTRQANKHSSSTLLIANKNSN